MDFFFGIQIGVKLTKYPQRPFTIFTKIFSNQIRYICIKKNKR